MLTPKFGSVFLAGFECSSKQYWDGRRLDLLETTRHFELCEQDYALCRRHGIHGARDGFRWNLIGAVPGVYDWSSVVPMLRAAKRRDITVIWDLCHYGYPEWLNVWSAYFVEEFARYTTEAVKLIRRETGKPPIICPLNEISFWAWLGGKEGKMAPAAIDKPGALKRQLVKAKLAGIAAARKADPDVTVICAEPLINIVPDSNDEHDILAASRYHESQFEAVDMMLGHRDQDLEGHRDAIDLIGINYYPHNQWRLTKGFIPLGHHEYKPLSVLLHDIWRRYEKPLFIAETGCEYSARPVWLSYVSQEVRVALEMGIPILGICIYPITAYKGWDNDRVCEVGLFSEADASGRRQIYKPLAIEIERQMIEFGQS